ncbi:hypothetical protein ELI16_32170 (plasmid) [Rhizobium ruizarguesonis]|uniref:AAA family ATPase n=1 Tax=Rhizobium ruizarguesonis TaxID=2081791 RepID=UPI00102F60B7|nr:AAA family ATPase [Rhizobium ruizarguesonis]TAW61378.1 hypothetical protein ELI16_32170 [Rhizobium ruizarguesonis]
MHLHAYRLRNYRRFKSAKIELGKEISIFVGSNNSGKTSATHAVHTFVSSAKDRLDRVPWSGVASALAVPSGQSREWISLPLAG